MTDRELIALGGLLHDIGKFLQRAKRKGFKFEGSDSEELNRKLGGWNDSLREKYEYEHAYLTSVFLEFLRGKGVIDENLEEKLDRWSARHHKPTDELESVIMQIADWYSSTEREADLGSRINLLHSVFERVSLKPYYVRQEEFEEQRRWLSRQESDYTSTEEADIPEEYLRTFGYYKLVSLKTGKEIFPVTFSGAILPIEGDNRSELLIIPSQRNVLEEAEKEEEGYRELLREFISEIQRASALGEGQLLNYIYYLLYKYTWCVPASTWDSEKTSRHYPDISLFDHSRMLSAIAVSLYSWAEEKGVSVQDIRPKGKKLPTDDEEAFLLVEGDIGGIQSFIYNVHKASESELSIAKALRGRSFFLTMLPEVIARYILRKLNYPITNALFIGGGKFQLLVGNTKNNLNSLKNIEDEINEWMFKEFHGELNLSMVWVPVKGSALRNEGNRDNRETYLDHVEKLQLELDRKKKRKLGKLIYEEVEKDFTGAREICPSCRSMKAEEGETLCEWCLNSQRWGEVLPKIGYIAFGYKGDGVTLKDIKTIEFGSSGRFGKVYLLERKDLEKVRHLPEVLNIDGTELEISKGTIVNGFKFIGHSAPKVSEDTVDFLDELWKSRGESEGSLKPGDILPFELLVEFAEGDKKLGFFRADVDYLGLILSDGLRFDEKGDKEIYTISRIATLSRMLDLFFTGYLDKLAERVSWEYLNERMERLRELKEKGEDINENELELLERVKENKGIKLGSLIYTVYSGGDDLFVIAPYDLAVKFAKELREEFRKYTCRNRDFGISGGIFVGRHNTPIHLVAEFTKELEDKAKSVRKEKDAVAIFNKAFPWDGESLVEKGISFCESSKFRSKNKKSMTFVDVLELAEKMVEYFKEGKFGRAFLYKLLYLHKQYCPNGQVDLRIYPKIYYQLGRNVKEDVRKDLADTLLNGMGGSVEVGEVVRNLNVILSLVLMKTRKGGG